MKIGIFSLIIAILAIFFEIFFFFLPHSKPGFSLILSIIAVILGGLGMAKDTTLEVARAGILFGITRIIVIRVIILSDLGITFSSAPS